MRALTIFMIALAYASACDACTTFCFEADGTRVFGKNYDWNVDDGLVVVNKRGVSKVAFTEENPARWTSRFGSVTFNQYGREFPSGGINEKGLVVELMWLDETTYPAPDGRAVLPTLQWIQYQLDNSATIDDVIKSDATVRIAPAGSAKIHFLIADARGGVATIEFIGGKLVAHRGKDLPYPVLTNDTYRGSVAYARAQKPADVRSTSSLDRFARAARGLSGVGDAIDSAFAMLQDVAQGDYTQWSIVYDIDSKRAYFRTRVQPSVRFIDVDALDLSCRTPVRVVDLNAALEGDVSAHLVDYSVDANRQLLGAAFAETEFLRATPAEFVEALARYPEHTSCAP
jgi:choloylglycine hydrolase